MNATPQGFFGSFENTIYFKMLKCSVGAHLSFAGILVCRLSHVSHVFFLTSSLNYIPKTFFLGFVLISSNILLFKKKQVKSQLGPKTQMTSFGVI